MSKTGIKNIEIPKGVINKDAYIRYIKKQTEIKGREDRFYQSKTSDYRFDFYTAHVNVLRQIEKNNIPDYEADIIKKKSKEFFSRMSKIRKDKYLAFKEPGSGYNGFGLLDSYKDELIGLFGRFYSITEAHNVITTKWGLSVTYQTVEKFRVNNLDFIQAEQDRYVRDWSGLKLVYKKSRLDEFSKLYEDRRIRYNESHSREDYKLLLTTLEAIRREIEGDRLTVDGSMEVNVKHSIDVHIQQNIFKELNILHFIVARVASRIGISDTVLMTKLENSYYAKFTGIKEPDNSLKSDEIYYPSREMYDFNKIKIKNVEIIKETAINKKIGENVSDSLMKSLQEKKRMIIESEKRVHGLEEGTDKKIVKKRERKVSKKNNVKGSILKAIKNKNNLYN